MNFVRELEKVKRESERKFQKPNLSKRSKTAPKRDHRCLKERVNYPVNTKSVLFIARNLLIWRGEDKQNVLWNFVIGKMNFENLIIKNVSLNSIDVNSSFTFDLSNLNDHFILNESCVENHDHLFFSLKIFCTKRRY